jgi:hypothetical protein
MGRRTACVVVCWGWQRVGPDANGVLDIPAAGALNPLSIQFSSRSLVYIRVLGRDRLRNQAGFSRWSNLIETASQTAPYRCYCDWRLLLFLQYPVCWPSWSPCPLMHSTAQLCARMCKGTSSLTPVESWTPVLVARRLGLGVCVFVSLRVTCTTQQEAPWVAPTMSSPVAFTSPSSSTFNIPH